MHQVIKNKSIVAIVIPARYKSTRLPGKPLVDIHGKPMIQHVYEKAKQVDGVDIVLVATDDQRVADVVEGFGGRYIMTSEHHSSGTDRLTEVMQHVFADIYINLQGDEPLVRPSDISYLLAGMISDSSVEVGTLCHKINAIEAENPNSVKVVVNTNGDTLYFSRAPIPYAQHKEFAEYLKHVGVYAYRRDVLEKYSSLPNAMAAQAESLEQLRLMVAGIKIRAYQVDPTGPGVDTPSCLERVRSILEGKPEKTASSLADVRLVITDVDGVLTDGSLYYDETGECLKKFHVRDGLGIRLLEESGIRVAVLSGRDSLTLRKRVQDLGITCFKFGVKDKFAACLELMTLAGVTAAQTVCIGDDSIDLPAFLACELSYAVADAPPYVQKNATGILEKAGGQGAFRELADLILVAQNKEHIFNSASGFASVMTGIAQ